jgi:hypothetical protein
MAASALERGRRRRKPDTRYPFGTGNRRFTLKSVEETRHVAAQQATVEKPERPGHRRHLSRPDFDLDAAGLG